MTKRTTMKYRSLMLSALVPLSLGLMITSCKDDDPPAKPQLSFAASTQTVKESDGEIQVQVVLDKAASQDVTIDYTLEGTATEKVAAGDGPYDYEIIGDYGELVIPKGETTGNIVIKLYSDTDYENADETIEISIDEVSLEEIEITRLDDMKVTVKQEDGLVALLEWGVDDGPYADVDMDLFLWTTNTTSQQLAVTNFRGVSGTSYTNWNVGSDPEFLFLPTAILTDGNYGLSCVYYAGTKEPMNFEVTFIEIVNQVAASTVTKKGVYTLANINKWDADDAPLPQLVTKFTKAGADYKEFEELTIPATGSRYGNSSNALSGMKRGAAKSDYTNQVSKFLHQKK